MKAEQDLKPTATTHPAVEESATMRAIVHPAYGAPKVLAVEAAPRPVPGDEQVLVRVRAAGVSIGDHHVVTGKPYLIRLSPFGGLPRPRNRVPGTALAGTVEAVGAKVTALRPGDEVFGQARAGAFAEYAAVDASLLVPRPQHLPWAETAAIPWGITALQALRDSGCVKPGDRVLVLGASGGVGTWAVQIGKALGAHVTGVCSTRNVDLVRRLGADEVIDYTRRDFADGGQRFEVMLDLVGNRSLSGCASVLVPRGRYVACSGGGGDWFGPIFRLLAMLFRSPFSNRKMTAFIAAPNRADLLYLKELVEGGKARPVIVRRVPLDEVPRALEDVGSGHAQGQTVLELA